MEGGQRRTNWRHLPFGVTMQCYKRAIFDFIQKELLTKKWARDWHKSSDRHKAADVACLAVRAGLSRVEYAFEERFVDAEKAADACARAA